MLRICVAVFVVSIAVFHHHKADAQELTLAVGFTDFDIRGDDSVVFEIEYRFRPVLQREVFSLAWAASAAVTGEGDAFVGGGLWTRWEWASGWFVDMSTMPGLYTDGARGNDLGSAFEIRSLLGVGFRFSDGSAVSAAATHKSNAGLASDNPGANTYVVRYHRWF